jgi:hypothetical protein
MIHLENANQSEEKSYSKIYRVFLDTVELPASYYDEMHSLKYSRHFYTPVELNDRDVLRGASAR